MSYSKIPRGFNNNLVKLTTVSSTHMFSSLILNTFHKIIVQRFKNSNYLLQHDMQNISNFSLITCDICSYLKSNLACVALLN